MIWSTYASSYVFQQMEMKSRRWYNKFAWLPTTIGDVTVWLESYEKRKDCINGGTYRRLPGSRDEVGYLGFDW